MLPLKCIMSLCPFDHFLSLCHTEACQSICPSDVIVSNFTCYCYFLYTSAPVTVALLRAATARLDRCHPLAALGVDVHRPLKAVIRAGEARCRRARCPRPARRVGFCAPARRDSSHTRRPRPVYLPHDCAPHRAAIGCHGVQTRCTGRAHDYGRRLRLHLAHCHARRQHNRGYT